jgi:DNA-directed RNA polymerase specialized sigma24 family protein
VFRRRTARGDQASSTEPWWEQPTPATCDELLAEVGLDVLLGTDPEALAALLQALAGMPDRERVVLRLRLGLDRGGVPRTVPEAGAELGVAETRMNQVWLEGVERLRAHNGVGPVDLTKR